MKCTSLIENEPRLSALTGLSRREFDALLPSFSAAVAATMDEQCMDGYIRTGRRWSSYANAPLPTDADKLVFILTYLRQNTTQAMHGALFGMTQPNVSKWYRLLLHILNQALAAEDALPTRNAPALQALLQTSTHVTETPFFVMMGRNA